METNKFDEGFVMNRLNLQKLKKDLMYSDDKSSTTELVSKIAKKAKEICEERKSVLPELHKAQIAIDKEIDSIEDILKKIHPTNGSVGDEYLRSEFVQSNITIDVVRACCEKIIEEANQYKKEVQSLCSQFENAKIRIVSVGKARSGKSLFTRLYSGIEDEDIIRAYGSGENENVNQDCTGTVCELEHMNPSEIAKTKWKEQNCVITVYYYSEAEIVEKINECLSLVFENSTSDKLSQSLPELPTSINALSDVKNLCSEEFAKKISSALKNIGTKEKIIKGLIQYFRSDKYIDEVRNLTNSLKTNGREIEKKKLTFYRDMTNNQCMYLCVKRIRIQIDMNKKHPGLFDDFIMADTKGVSTKAGILSNKETYRAIDDSDAVFTVYLAKQGNDDQEDFYSELSDHYFANQNFVNKHFAILNRDSRVKNVNTKEIMDDIEEKKVANTCYDGILWVDNNNKAEDVNYSNEDCCFFANMVILDMLNRIAKHVLDFDKERISRCNLLGNELKAKMESLMSLFESLKYERYDSTKELEQKIPELYKKIWDKLCLDYKDDLAYEPDADSSEMYSKKRNDKDCIYTLISGENECKVSEANTEEKEITKAINWLYPTWQELAKKKQLGNSNNVGGYVEFISSRLLERLKDGISKKMQSKIIDNSKLRNELFNMIADELKLKIILQEKDITKFFGKDRVVPESIHNVFFCKLSDLYDQLYATTFPPHESLFTPWDVLQQYVKDVNEKERPKYDASFIVDEKLLIQKLIEETNNIDLAKIFTEMDSALSKTRHNCTANITDFFQYDLESQDALLSFYKDHNADAIVLDDETLSKRISLTDKWDIFIKLRQKYNELCKKGITEIPLYLIKSEETKTA